MYTRPANLNEVEWGFFPTTYRHINLYSVGIKRNFVKTHTNYHYRHQLKPSGKGSLGFIILVVGVGILWYLYACYNSDM